MPSIKTDLSVEFSISNIDVTLCEKESKICSDEERKVSIHGTVTRKDSSAPTVKILVATHCPQADVDLILETNDSSILVLFPIVRKIEKLLFNGDQELVIVDSWVVEE